MQLQYSPTSVSTKALTKSFGWGTYDAFMQHDIQEMEAKLCEKLEEKMKVQSSVVGLEFLRTQRRSHSHPSRGLSFH